MIAAFNFQEEEEEEEETLYRAVEAVGARGIGHTVLIYDESHLFPFFSGYSSSNIQRMLEQILKLQSVFCPQPWLRRS